MALDLKDAKEIESLGSGVIVLDFWAEWAKPCAQMNALCDQLAEKYPNVKFVKIEAEKFDTLTDKYGVTAVPSFIFVKNQQKFDFVEGADAPQLAAKVDVFSKAKGGDAEVTKAIETSETKEDITTRLTKLVNSAPVMLFMKGVPSKPQCGFSSKIVDLLNKDKIIFASFNILTDEEVRQGLKTFSNWPTYPQLYVKGSLVGGLDIVREMAENGELKDIVPTECIRSE